MGSIRILPDHLANQIAAGEVVERPASALKELMENSLDAGATTIRIALEAGGKRRIRIEDDGCGMDRDDCLMALERHATSKLTRAEDLFSIRTLGFRGEALPSIASVSQMTLESRHLDAEAGVRVSLRGSKIIKVEEIARPHGTVITIDQLFFNIPARRKFLRSTETELSWMVNLVTQYSMAHIDKAFHLEHGGRTLIDVTPVAELKERIYQHFGKSMLDDLIQFSTEQDWLSISGMAGRPTLQKTSRGFQYLFVNGRLVRDKVLNHAIAEAYQGFGEGRTFPVVFLFLTLPSSEVDVNVHPAKTEVKFIHGQVVHDAVRDALRRALVEQKFTIPYRFREGYHAEPSGRRADPWTRPPEHQPALPGNQAHDLPLFEANSGAPARDPGSSSAPKGQLAATSAYQRFVGQFGAMLPGPGNLPRVVNHSGSGSNSGLGLDAGPEPNPGGAPGGNREPQPSAHLFTGLTNQAPHVIGQFRESYILAEQDGDLLLIDQHVAHERLLYDQIVEGIANNDIERQVLLVPETLELTPAQSVALQELMPQIKKFGFDLDPFDGNTFVIREMPNFAKGQDLARLVVELVEKAQGQREETALETMIDHIAATKACKAAVKINMRLTPEKMEHFIAELWRSSSPLFCPHGRPILLRFKNEEIEKNFLRR